MTPEIIVALARETLETPFRHQGRSPVNGIDCVGVAAHVANGLGLPYIDQIGYARQPFGGQLESALDEQPCLVRIPVAQASAGDVLVMRFAGDPQHVAILAGKTIIHAFEKNKKVVEHDLTEYWRTRIVRAYRFVEVTL